MKTSWKKYIEYRSTGEPREILIEAVKNNKHKGHALDLGAGAMNDSLYLLMQGFESVTAIDMDETARKFAEKIYSKKFLFQNIKFQNFDFMPNTYDLINAQYVLPYLAPHEFMSIFVKIISSLKYNGIFCGQLFGDRDSWNISDNNKTFHTKSEACTLFETFDVIKFDEDEKDTRTALGKLKHFHLFHFIIRK